MVRPEIRSDGEDGACWLGAVEGGRGQGGHGEDSVLHSRPASTPDLGDRKPIHDLIDALYIKPLQVSRGFFRFESEIAGRRQRCVIDDQANSY